jgi:stearoyl-CoA desaturase (delta-9 desaturase)
MFNSNDCIYLYSSPQCHVYTLMWAFICWPISGLGITAGAHRLWAHRSYKATWPVRLFLMLANSMANQGSIYHWSRDHRVHHKHSEHDADPHDARRGFFFAHVGWLLVHKVPAVAAAGKELNYDDLVADEIVMWQHKYDPWFTLFMCLVFPALVPMLWGENFWNGYWTAGALRYVFVLHATWCVNSVAHLWGSRPYAPEINPAENLFVAIWALGEGWHNWHHKYPYDYATSEHGIFQQFNPTKLFIDTMCLLGLASDCKRATGAWNRLKTARLQEKLHMLNSNEKVLIDKDEKDLDSRGW